MLNKSALLELFEYSVMAAVLERLGYSEEKVASDDSWALECVADIRNAQESQIGELQGFIYEDDTWEFYEEFSDDINEYIDDLGFDFVIGMLREIGATPSDMLTANREVIHKIVHMFVESLVDDLDVDELVYEDEE